MDVVQRLSLQILYDTFLPKIGKIKEIPGAFATQDNLGIE
jgi:hypothetical protein